MLSFGARQWRNPRCNDTNREGFPHRWALTRLHEWHIFLRDRSRNTYFPVDIQQVATSHKTRVLTGSDSRRSLRFRLLIDPWQARVRVFPISVRHPWCQCLRGRSGVDQQQGSRQIGYALACVPRRVWARRYNPGIRSDNEFSAWLAFRSAHASPNAFACFSHISFL